MRIAVIYNDQDVFVEFKPEVFKELLRKYLAETGDIDKAFEKIIQDLKKKTLIN